MEGRFYRCVFLELYLRCCGTVSSGDCLWPIDIWKHLLNHAWPAHCRKDLVTIAGAAFAAGLNF